MTNKIRNSSVLLLSTIMLTSVFAFTNMPTASAATITITFDGTSGAPTSYTESGMTVTSLYPFPSPNPFGHLHFFGDNALFNHSSCCSSPYEFDLGGAAFTVVSVEAFGQFGTNEFISSSGSQSLVNGANAFGTDFAGITSFLWENNPGGSGFIDNLVIQTTIDVDVDIKPGSDPSSVNCKENKKGDINGVVPIAILGSQDIDLSKIDLSTLQINGVSVTEAHDKNHAEAVDNDQFIDTVLHIEKAGICEATADENAYPLKETATVTLTGSTTDGDEFEGTADIRIVKR